MMATEASGAAALRGLRIISAALLGGLLSFLAVALFMRTLMHQTGQLDLVAWIATGFGVLSVPLASVMRAARWPGTTPEQDPGYWQKRRAAHIVSLGLVEGPAFFCCIALLVSPLWWPLAALLVPVGAMVAWFPRDTPQP